MTPLSRAGWYLGLPLRMALLALLGVYRGTLGQLAGGRCRFHPTCSAYAIEAIHAHGAVRGLGMAVWRVVRCNPLFAGGLDPVTPPRRVMPSYAPEARGGRIETSATSSYKEPVVR